MSAFTPILENEEQLAVNSKMPTHHHTRRYDSFATLSTETNTWTSSSSSQQSEDSVGNDKLQNNLSVEEDSILSSVHSRQSSYSDISCDGAGYYNRYSRHEWRSRRDDACSFIEDNLFTMHNFKVVISGVLWFACYMFMGLFGGTVAYLHFQRKDGDVPEPLPDFGYDAIPVSTHSGVEFDTSDLMFISHAIIIYVV